MAAAVVTVVALAYVLFADRSRLRSRNAQDSGVIRSRIVASHVKHVTARTEQKVMPQLPAGDVLKRASSDDEKKGKPISENEVKNLLDKVVADLLTEIGAASRAGDKKTVLALVEKLRSLKYGREIEGKSSSHGSSVGYVKQKILECLGPLGVDAIEPIVEFLGDENPQVVATAEELLFQSLMDVSLGDYNRADIVTSAAEEMTDTDSLVRLFQEFLKMRHSVGVEALAQICKTGTPEAKAEVQRAMRAFTGDVTITSPDQLAEWLEDHPDSVIDDWYYGPRDPKGE